MFNFFFSHFFVLNLIQTELYKLWCRRQGSSWRLYRDPHIWFGSGGRKGCSVAGQGFESPRHGWLFQRLWPTRPSSSLSVSFIYILPPIFKFFILSFPFLVFLLSPSFEYCLFSHFPLHFPFSSFLFSHLHQILTLPPSSIPRPLSVSHQLNLFTVWLEIFLY